MAAFRLPVVDLAEGRTAAGRRRLARTVDAACADLGFLVLVGHGVDARLLAEAFALSAEFFALPLEAKQALAPPEPGIPRGYAAFASKNLGRTYGLDTPPDLREQFFIGPPAPDLSRLVGLPEAAPFYAANIWPPRPERFRPVFETLYARMEKLGAALMRLFALALDLDEAFFDDKIDNHFSTLPTNSYPALECEPLPGQVRAGQHTDFGSLTLLAIDGGAGGLQIRLGDGEWRDVVPPPDALVVNLGDMMQRWTNERWRSTLHRVVNPAPEAGPVARRSLGYFLHPNFDAEVACLPNCAGPGRPPRFEPILAGQHMREKLLRRLV